MIDWEKTTKEEIQLISKIATRAQEMFDIKDRMSLVMDIEAANLSCPLKLNELLEADDFSFGHDIAGICNNINRTTGKIENCFLPRFAA